MSNVETAAAFEAALAKNRQAWKMTFIKLAVAVAGVLLIWGLWRFVDSAANARAEATHARWKAREDQDARDKKAMDARKRAEEDAATVAEDRAYREEKRVEAIFDQMDKIIERAEERERLEQQYLSDLFDETKFLEKINQLEADRTAEKRRQADVDRAALANQQQAINTLKSIMDAGELRADISQLTELVRSIAAQGGRR